MAVLLEDVVKFVELWLKLSKKRQPYIDPNLDPILLVPGIGGSILKAVDDKGQEDRVWVRVLAADYKCRTKLWSRFDPKTGKSVSLDPKTTIRVPEDRYGLYAIDTLDPDMILGRECVYYFHDMIVEMLTWGFQEGTTLFGFGYDFRQSNRSKETLNLLVEKLESIYAASGGKKINIISHSMGGLLVKCFMCLHRDIFEKYVKNWIAIAAPFQGAPGYVTSAFLNGMSFVDGWEQNFFISKWNMHQLLIECPSIYELMACPEHNWQHIPLLEIWREKHDSEGNSQMILDSYRPREVISVLEKALSSNVVNYDGEIIYLPFNLDIVEWADETRKILSSAEVPAQVKFYNIYGTSLETPQSVCYGNDEMPVADLEQICFFKAKYICVDGDGTVPSESAKADGLKAEARVGIPGEHRGILADRHLFRILKHWLKADHDPYYDPLYDYVILPTSFQLESHHEKGLQVTALKEEWEIITEDQVGPDYSEDEKPLAGSISVSRGGDDRLSPAEACVTTVVVSPQSEGRQHVQLNALGVSG